MDTMVIVSVEIGIGIAGLKLLYLWWIVDTIVAVSVEIGLDPGHLVLHNHLGIRVVGLQICRN